MLHLPVYCSLVKSTYVPLATGDDDLGTYRGTEGSQSSYSSPLSMSGCGANSSSIGPKFPRFSGMLQCIKSSRDRIASVVGDSKVKDAGRLAGGKSSLRKGGERAEPGEPKLDSDSATLCVHVRVCVCGVWVWGEVCTCMCMHVCVCGGGGACACVCGRGRGERGMHVYTIGSVCLLMAFFIFALLRLKSLSSKLLGGIIDNVSIITCKEGVWSDD